MEGVADFVEQLKRAHEGNAWHGTALSELLAGIGAHDAAARPIPDAHSIWEIALHMAAWNNLWVRRLEGQPADEPEEGDWPAVEEATQDGWERTLAKVNGAHQSLLRAVAALPGLRLQEKVVGKDYSVGFMLYGILQHNVYHAGQIALLKKAKT